MSTERQLPLHSSTALRQLSQRSCAEAADAAHPWHSSADAAATAQLHGRSCRNAASAHMQMYGRSPCVTAPAQLNGHSSSCTWLRRRSCRATASRQPRGCTFRGTAPAQLHGPTAENVNPPRANDREIQRTWAPHGPTTRTPRTNDRERATPIQIYG